MNCQEAEAVITDLARNGVSEVEARDRALAHLTECPQCGERMAGEKRLTAGLRAWATASMDEQAPPRVEEELRAAFQRQAPARHGRGWFALAAAASVAAAILVFKLPGPPPRTVSLAPETARVVAPPAPAPVVEIHSPKRQRGGRQANRLPQPTEIVTEFLPVAEDDGWTPLDGGRLVRVRLPRSALGVFGLPMAEERGLERVQADVMLSNDGVLRAIRFVR